MIIILSYFLYHKFKPGDKIDLLARADGRGNTNPVIVTVLMDEVTSGIEKLILQAGEVCALSFNHRNCGYIHVNKMIFWLYL